MSVRPWRQRLRKQLAERSPEWWTLGALFADVVDLIPMHTALRLKEGNHHGDVTTARWKLVLHTLHQIRAEFERDSWRHTARTRVRLLPQECIVCHGAFFRSGDRQRVCSSVCAGRRKTKKPARGQAA
jgi:hypothetical protein